MKVLVTRPADQAAEWVARLRARAVDAAELPLIGIAAPADPAGVSLAWSGLVQQRLVVFVSPNAAQQFFALRPAGAVWPESVDAASPGPGTSGVLERLGVPRARVVEPASDAPQFDSEALWAQLQSRNWTGASVLIVRGDGGREWLADTLRGRGARVGYVSAYRRAAPQLAPIEEDRLQAALRAPRQHLWLFSSSEAIDHLQHLAPAAAWGEARALATHPRIAESARSAGFGTVHECRPAMDAVVACIQSIEA
jgi:uroporphyrinogen-III synthase